LTGAVLVETLLEETGARAFVAVLTAVFGTGLTAAGAFFGETLETAALEREADFEALAMASVTIERFREQAVAYNTLFCCSASGEISFTAIRDRT